MFATDDTIVAIATPPGRGALGVVRLSGPRALEIAGALLACGATLQPRHATFTRFVHRPDSAEQSVRRPGAAERPNAREADPALDERSNASDPATAVDEVVATLFPSPHSYTGDDVIEITAHG